MNESFPPASDHIPHAGKKVVGGDGEVKLRPGASVLPVGWRVGAGATAWGCGLFRFAPRWMASVAGAGAGGVVLPAFSLGIVGRGQRPAAQVKGSNRSGQEAVDKRGELLSLRQPRFAHGNHKAQTNMEGTP